MAMTVEEKGQVQKMERRVTDERPLMFRLFETLIPGWLPLLDEDALNASPWIATIPCHILVPSPNAGRAGSTLKSHICARSNMEWTVFQCLAHWRPLQTIWHRPGQGFDCGRDLLSHGKRRRVCCVAAWYLLSHDMLTSHNQPRFMTEQHSACHSVFLSLNQR